MTTDQAPAWPIAVTPPSSPRSGRLARHLVVFCAALGGFVDLYVTQAIFPDLHARFGVTVAGAGALVTITTLTLAFCAPFASIVAGAIGARRATLIGLAGLTVCAALMAFVSGTGLLVALRAAQGLFIPAVLASVLASNQVADDASDAHALSGTYVSGTILGGILGRLLPATLLPVAGWEIAFIAFSVLHLVLFLVVALLSPTPSPTLAPVGTVSGFATWLKELRSMPRQRAAGLGLAGFSLLFAQAATFTYITIRLSAGPFGWGTGALGLVYLVFLPSLVFLKTSRGLVVRLGPLPAFKRAAGVVWLGLLLTLVSSAVVLVLGLVLVAVGVFLCQAILAQQVSEASAADGPHVPGIYLCCYYLGSSAGAVAPGLLWSELGWPGCIALIAIVQFCAVAGTWWLHRAPAPLTSPAPSAEPQAVANPSLTESDPARPGFVSNESEGLPG